MDNLGIIELYEKNGKNSGLKEFQEKTDSTLRVEAKRKKTAKDTEWLDVIEQTIPYLDNIFRKPNRFIVNEEEIVKIEQTKKVTVETIKHLSKNTNLIQTIDEKTGDVIPSKLLDIRGIDTFNTYENRVIYTLLDKLERFVKKRLEELENFEMKNEKTLEFASKSKDLGGKYNIPHGLANAIILPIVLKEYGKKIHKKLYKLGLYCNLFDKNTSISDGAQIVIKKIEDMNKEMNIGNKIKGINKNDIQELAKYALKEANPLYPVPVLWDYKKIVDVYLKIGE